MNEKPNTNAPEPCPKCGHMPMPGQEESVFKGECPACGIIFEKFYKARRIKTEAEAARKSFVPAKKQLSRLKSNPSEQTRNSSRISFYLLLFGLLNLLTACVFDLAETPVMNRMLDAEGGRIGPITVENGKDIFKIRVDQTMPDNQWSYVSGEVLDESEEYLFGFGEELWSESGYDEGERWQENKSDYEILLILDKGIYYLNFEIEKPPEVKTPAYVRIDKAVGSSVLPGKLGWLGLIAALVAFIASRSSLPVP